MQPQERREFERYPYPQDSDLLQTAIVWAGSPGYDPQDVKFVDVCRAGLGFVSHNQFAVGDALKIRITQAQTAPLEITAIVCNRRRLDEFDPASVAPEDPAASKAMRYGVYFEYDAKDQDPHAEQVIAAIEEEVRRLYLQPI